MEKIKLAQEIALMAMATSMIGHAEPKDIKLAFEEARHTLQLV